MIWILNTEFRVRKKNMTWKLKSKMQQKMYMNLIFYITRKKRRLEDCKSQRIYMGRGDGGKGLGASYIYSQWQQSSKQAWRSKREREGRKKRYKETAEGTIDHPPKICDCPMATLGLPARGHSLVQAQRAPDVITLKSDIWRSATLTLQYPGDSPKWKAELDKGSKKDVTRVVRRRRETSGDLMTSWAHIKARALHLPRRKDN